MFGLEAVNGEDLTKKIRGSLTRLICADLLVPNSPSLGLGMSPLLLIQGTCPTLGRSVTYFRKERRRGRAGP